MINEEPTSESLSRWIVGSGVTGIAWIWAAVLFRRRDMMRMHNISINIVDWQQGKQSGTYFHLRHRTLLDQPLDTILDGNTYASRLVARAGRKLHPAPWYKPWRRFNLTGSPSSPLRGSPQQGGIVEGTLSELCQQKTRFIFLNPGTAHASVMRSLVNRISERFPEGAAADAMGLPVDQATFYIALTCEHELVWFTKTRTMLIEKHSLERLAQLVSAGVELTPENVGLEHLSNAARLLLLVEWAELFAQNPSRFWTVSISLHPKTGTRLLDSHSSG